MASLTLEAIIKRFGPTTALNRIDLHVADGEFCVLLGPSGCGKSTLLNIIAGLIPQDSGRVLLDGQSIDRMTPKERDVAMVFQSYALYPHMTVRQNLGFGLRMRGLSKEVISNQVMETARQLGIQDLLDRKPRELSGGQQQRVAMGRALVRRPRLFLLDEPLSNLDAQLRADVRLELKRLHRRIKGTVIYVTHDQMEAMTLGDRVVIMKDGTIHQADKPETVYARPADRFVASFIGSPRMNLFKGRLSRQENHIRFQGNGFTADLGQLTIEVPDVEAELGIRPEDITVVEAKREGLKARVDLVSNVGSEKYVHVRLGHENCVVRAPKNAFYPGGDEVALVFDPGKINLFIAGKRVWPLDAFL